MMTLSAVVEILFRVTCRDCQRSRWAWRRCPCRQS